MFKNNLYNSIHFDSYGGSKLSEDLIKRLIVMQYQRNDLDPLRGTFSVKGDVIDIAFYPQKNATVPKNTARRISPYTPLKKKRRLRHSSRSDNLHRQKPPADYFAIKNDKSFLLSVTKKRIRPAKQENHSRPKRLRFFSFHVKDRLLRFLFRARRKIRRQMSIRKEKNRFRRRNYAPRTKVHGVLYEPNRNSRAQLPFLSYQSRIYPQ